MKLVQRFICSGFLLASIAGVALHTQTPQPTPTYRMGLKSIAIPSPSTELVETGSDYRVLLELLAPNQNRLIAGFLLPDELKQLTISNTSLSRYALAETSRSAEFATVTPELFKQLTDAMSQQFGASVTATLKDQEDEVNRRMKVYNATAQPITMDQPYMLGSLFSKPNASGFGMIMQATVNGAQKKMAAGVSFVRVQDRVLFLYVYTRYEGDESINWIRATTERWADAVLKANQ